MHTINKAKLFSHITKQHINDAAFLWLLRSQAMMQSQQTHTTLKKWEHRINNHLKGLLVTPEIAWELCQQAAEIEESGEIFVLAILAFDSKESHKINTVIEWGMKSASMFKGVLSALGWLPANKVDPWLKPWLESQNPAYRYLSIATCSIRRIDPHTHLTALFDDEQSREHLPLYCRMLRLVGELKRQDLSSVLVQAQNHQDPSVVFWACWSARLLGDQQALQGLAPYLLQAGPQQTAAIEIAFRQPPTALVWQWLNTLANTPGQIRPTIKALAALGDPQGIDWLLTQMKIPEYAKIAGEAFSTITGVDLKQAQLISTQPDNIDDCHDELNLPTPHAEKVSQHWQLLRSQFTAGQRYFLGQPVTPPLLKHTFLHGPPRHRLAAALELALLTPAHLYLNAKATLTPQDTT